MQLKDVVHTIKDKNYRFELSIPGKDLTLPKQTVENAEMMRGSVEDYIRQIADAHQAKEIGIHLFQKNGSSHIRKGFFLVPIVPVVASTDTVDRSTKPVDTSTDALNGTTPVTSPTPSKTSHMDPLAEVKIATLTTELQFTKRELEEKANRLKEFEKKNDLQHNEILQLTRDLASQKDKLELEYQKKELALESGKKQGLFGVMNEIKEIPPEGWKMLAGVFLPKDHPLNKWDDQPAQSKELSGVKHEDPAAQSVIELIQDRLVKEPAEVVGMFAVLVDYLTKHHTDLTQLYEQVTKPAAKKETTTTTTT